MSAGVTLTRTLVRTKQVVRGIVLRNAFAVLAIVICGAGLAGSLVEQITGSAVVEESATSAAEDAFSFEPAKSSNETDSNEVRFSIGQLMQRKQFTIY